MKARAKKVQPTVFGKWTEKNGKKIYEPNPGSKPAKQSFKDQCNINSIVDRAKRTGTLAHVNKHAGFFADMTRFDYEEAQNQIAATNSAFYELDAEIRREFENNPGKFRNWAADKTPEEIVKAIPALAAPGKQFPDVVGGKATDSPTTEGGPPPSPPEGEGTPVSSNSE